MPHSSLLTDLLTLPTAGGKRRVKTPQQWRSKRDEIRRRILDVIGPFPTTSPALEPEIEATTEREFYIRHKVSYTSESGERVLAYLMVPRDVAGPAPAVICFHQTVAQGKDEPAGLSGDPDLFHAHHLARRGYVTLAPDHLAAGERAQDGYDPYDTAPFYEGHPEWSAVGKAVWDARKAADYLGSLDIVDPERIGCIGHSLGGTCAVLAAAFDERIKASVSNCGITTFVQDPNRLNWARDKGYVYVPKLRSVFLKGERPPFDWHEVVALIAPRAFLNTSALNDSCFAKTDALAELAIRVSKVYRLLGAEQCFASFLHGSGHGFNAETRALAYAWLDRWLKEAVTDDG